MSEALRDHKALWDHREIQETLVHLDLLGHKERLECLDYLGNLGSLAVMGILDLQEDLANLESVVYLECLEFQVQKVTGDFLVLMVQKETQDHLVKREKMELLV